MPLFRVTKNPCCVESEAIASWPVVGVSPLVDPSAMPMQLIAEEPQTTGAVPTTTDPLAVSVTPVALPVLSTLNSDTPPTCKSISFDPVPEPVLVTFSKIPASTTPEVFHVGNTCRAGTVWAPFRESLMVNGGAVDPAKVLISTSWSPEPVAAEVSPNVNAVWLLVVWAQFHTCAPLLPFTMVLAPVAAVIDDSAPEPPPVPQAAPASTSNPDVPENWAQ